MTITPTPLTAALAGAFAALAWPLLWSWFGSSSATGSMELIVGTLLVVAVPAHAFVVGFNARRAPDARTLDTALLKRIGCWIGAAAVTAAIASMSA